NDKDSARASVAAWLSLDFPIVLRINGAQTPWFKADLELCGHAGVVAVMLAKAEQVDHVARVGAVAPLIPLIESAAGFANLHGIAHATGVTQLAFGAIDL